MSGELITEGPEYDPADPYHVRLWELAGRPDTAEDGWRPTITLILQPGGAYERRDLPMQNPLTDVEKEALEKAAPAKALVVKDAQLARADVAEAMAATKDGSDNASLKRAVESLAKALDTVLAKMAGADPDVKK